MPTTRLGIERSQVEALETAAQIIMVMAEKEATEFAALALLQIADAVEDVATALSVDMAAAGGRTNVSVERRFIEIVVEPCPHEGDPIYVLDNEGIRALPIGCVVEAEGYFPHRFEKLDERKWLDQAMQREVGEPGFAMATAFRIVNPECVGLDLCEYAAG